MKKYLREILKFLLIILVLVLAVFFISSIYKNNIKEKNANFAKNDQIFYIKNQNRIEYQYSMEKIDSINEELVRYEDGKDSNYLIYYPKKIESKLPLIVWAGDKKSSKDDYEQSLKSLSSYGFMVLSISENDLGSGDKTIDAINFLSKDADFKIKDKVDFNNIGLAGHGVGACEVLNASYKKNSEQIKAIFLTSLPKLGLINNDSSIKNRDRLSYDFAKVSHPIFITAGTGKFDSFSCPLEDISENINKIDPNIEAYGALRKKYDNNLVNNYHALGYMNAWFDYKLNNNTTAANVFMIDEEIKNNPKWAWIRDNRK